MKIKLPSLRPIIVFADDWTMYEKPNDIIKNFRLSPIWICGWLIQETDKILAIALEYTEANEEDEEQSCKTVVVPKSCIRYQKFIPIAQKKRRKNP